MDLQLGHSAVKVTLHDAVAKQFQATHSRLDKLRRSPPLTVLKSGTGQFSN